MKTEISRDSHQPEKRYSGVYQQQGRMLTDADWNELVEILKERLNDALKDVVGNGSPLHGNIVNNETDPPNLQWGYVHVDGIQGAVRPDEGATLQPAFEYDHQEDFPEAPDLPSSPDDNFIYYADVWERTVTHLMDERLRDKGLHGADTCTRKQTMAQVKWCPYDTGNPSNPDNDPEQSAKNPAKGDAKLTVTLLQKTIQPDPCDPCESQLDVESKIGNYLFRVEVHHVIGDADNPSEVTLKWSSENAAEQYALKNAAGDYVEPPAEFKSGQWAYEFFDETSERHLGVHLATGFTPSREELTEGYPSAVPSRNFVRRWDGYCRLIKNSGNWEVADQFDRNQSGSGSVSFTGIAEGKLTVNLDAQTLILTLINNSFAAGDYWLAEVREAEHEEGDQLITDEIPHGIEHHYLTLGKVVGGALEANPEADRKYAFPPLTEMTRMFLAGGDGQEVMPGQPLPQPLRVGVANGEWPVEGATVRFQIEAGGGSLSQVNGGKTNADGIAECEWTPGSAIDADYRVKATLVDPDHVNDTSMDMDPPVYFYANLIAADQVAYDPLCEPIAANTVHKLLVEDADTLTPPAQLILGTDGYYTVQEVLDAFLCRLKAKHIPYDPTQKPERWEDINEEDEGGPLKPETVQDALDNLVENLESSDIIYGFPDSCDDTAYGVKSLNSYVREDLGKTAPNSITKIKDLWDKLLCLLDANRIPYNPTLKEASWRDIKEIGHLGISWSREEETPGGPVASKIVKDGSGNVIAAASSMVIGGGPSTGITQKFFSILVKLDDAGHVVWKKEFNAIVGGLGVQSDGTIVIAGSFRDDLDLGGDTLPLSSTGQSDIYVARLDVDGEVFWNDQFGAAETERLTGLAISSDDAIYLTGYFKEMFNFGGSDLVPGADQDIFIAKLNADGSHAWSNNYARSGEVKYAQLQIGRSDNIIISGSFAGGLDFGGDPLTSSAPSTDSVFLAKLNDDGDHQWSYKFGGANDSGGSGLAIDDEENLLLCGYYQDVVNFGGDDLPTANNKTAFVAKFTDNGSDITEQWSKQFASSVESNAIAIATDADNNIVFSGNFSGVINFGGGEINAAEGSDAFVARLAGNGDYLWANRFSVGQKLEVSQSIVLDNDGYPTFAWQLAKNPVLQNDTTLNHITKLDWEMRIAPATVQEALDDLVENIESSDINYRLPVCAGTNDSVRKRLPSISAVPDETALKINTLFDALLCELDASSIPFDRNTDAGSLIDGFVDTAGDTMTGALRVQDNLIVDDNIGVGTSVNPPAKLAVNGGVHVGGESDPGNDNLLVDGDCTIGGNLSVNGTTTTVNTQELTIEDPIITLNRYDNLDPNSRNSGIEVYRGSDAKAHITWNESLDRWEYGIDENMLPIAGGQQALVTGSVSFINMPVGAPMISNWIDPGLGSGKLCVVLGNWTTSTLYTIGDENNSFRDVICRAEVNTSNGKIRILAERISGKGRETRKIQWWAMLPGPEENEQVVSIGITLSPPSASIQTGDRVDFNAVVTGTTNTVVNWQVQEGAEGGSINTNGLYTSPDVTGVFHVVATSSADSAVTDTATVTVTNSKDNDKTKDVIDIGDKLKDAGEKLPDVVPGTLEGLSQSKTTSPQIDNFESGIQPTGRAFITSDERPDLSRPPGGRRE